MLREIEQRVLWLSTAIVHHANRVRPNPTGLKVGGHQASSASMVSIMTALWFEHLQRRGPGVGQAARLAGAARDQLPARRAGRALPDDAARSSAGCRATRAGPRTPTRSTTPPARSASVRPRRSGARSPAATSTRTVRRRPARGRQYSLVGDAELDEGAVLGGDPRPDGRRARRGRWIVDLNRQSLDRVVPNIGATRLQGMFAAAGWQVLTVKYGRLLRGAVRPARRRRRCAAASTRCPTRSTSGCCAAPPASCASGCPATGPDAARSPRCSPALDDDDAARRGPQPRRARPGRARRGVRARSTTPGRR